MPAIFITLFVKSFAFLLSFDSKIKALLNDVCWFNSVNDLAKNTLPVAECLDTQMAQYWSSLWECAGQVLHSGGESRFYGTHTQSLPACLSPLIRRKRAELAFRGLNSSLHQLVLCRHASGSDDDHLLPSPQLFMKHNARFRHCAFLLPESINEDALCTLFV